MLKAFRGSPKASHIKASQSHFPRFGVRIPDPRFPYCFFFPFFFLASPCFVCVFFLRFPRILGILQRESPCFFGGFALVFFFSKKKSWVGGPRIFSVFRVFAPWNLLKTLLFFSFWGEKDLPHLPRVGFESLISKLRPTGSIVTGLRRLGFFFVKTFRRSCRAISI